MLAQSLKSPSNVALNHHAPSKLMLLYMVLLCFSTHFFFHRETTIIYELMMLDVLQCFEKSSTEFVIPYNDYTYVCIYIYLHVFIQYRTLSLISISQIQTIPNCILCSSLWVTCVFKCCNRNITTIIWMLLGWMYFQILLWILNKNFN